MTPAPTPTDAPGPVADRSNWVEASDERVGTGFAGGVEACLDEAYARWGSLVYTLAMRTLGNTAEAEDVTQQTFVDAWRGRRNYQPDRGSLGGWLVGTARHRIADRQRGRVREMRLVVTVQQQVQLREQSEPLDVVTDRLMLSHEIARLGSPRETILRQFYYEGKTFPEIAEQLGLPLATVKSHARRALLRLRAQLTELP